LTNSIFEKDLRISGTIILIEFSAKVLPTQTLFPARNGIKLMG
jgi:hypothetical protein